MLKIKFNTINFENKKRRGATREEYNNLIVGLNGEIIEAKTEEEAKEIIRYLAGWACSEDVYEKMDKRPRMEIEKDSTKIKVEIKLPGLACGYVNLDKRFEKLSELNQIKISFNDFYDLRQKPFFKGAFIEVFLEEEVI